MTATRLAAVILLLSTATLAGQSFAPPATLPPDEETLARIKAKTAELGEALKGLPEAAVADVDIFHKAAVWIVRHQEWYGKDYPKWTLAVLDRGLERARQVKRGPAPWRALRRGEPRTKMVYGYRSAIDGSVQPYAVTYPKGFGTYMHRLYRLDVVLHGRDASLTEVKFLYQHDNPKADPPDLDYLVLEVYGRGNNAYRWAGEADVFEAVNDYLTTLGQKTVDRNQLVLRGFSMGGAGAWHLGLHHPAFWCSVSPGAGFTITKGYAKGLLDPLPPYQEACLHVYDAVDYAENAADVPVVAYGGEKDPQLQAAKNVETRLKPLGIPMTLLVGPNTEHKYHPDALKEILRLQAEHASKPRPAFPKVHFVTYTPLFGDGGWLKVHAQEKPYEKSTVEGEKSDQGFTIKTANVRQLAVDLKALGKPDASLVIDGQNLTVPIGLDGPALLAKANGRWAAPGKAGPPIKNAQVMGPIDHAFMGKFVCVRGTGKPWNPAVQTYADAALERFRQEWDKYMRSELPVIKDTDPLPAAGTNLILFGDPGSNRLIKDHLVELPLQWDQNTIRFRGQDYPAASHVPVLIYPQGPTGGYVVLNSGHTFHAAEFEGTNALLFPRLGDYAVLKPAPTVKEPAAAAVVTAGLFDADWK